MALVLCPGASASLHAARARACPYTSLVASTSVESCAQWRTKDFTSITKQRVLCRPLSAPGEAAS
eukprot:12063623-Alexandrium_andersonii.AAC.1